MFHAIVGFSLRHRLFVLLVAAALLGWGALVARDMPIDLLPELHAPMVTVVTEAGGLATEEVEHLVTQPIEALLAGVPGLAHMRSSSTPGFSLVHLGFAWGSDPYRNRQVAAERLAQAHDRLPPGVAPQLAPMASVTGLIMQVAATGGDPMALREFVDWQLRPRLLAIPGVSQVYNAGGAQRSYRFIPDPIAMASLDIAAPQVEQTLSAFGTNTSGGFSTVGDTEYAIRNLGATRDLDDIRNLVVAYRGNRQVLLGQVGRVEFAAKLKRGDGAYNGQPAVLSAIVKHPAANTVEVSAAVRRLLVEMGPGLPPGVAIDQITYDQSELIVDSLGNVGAALRDAVVIIAVIVLAFLGNASSAGISLIAIPLSLMVSALLFRLFGLTINTMTLGGVAIAIGALVDDSLVNVENIVRRLGQPAGPAGRDATGVIADASQEVRSGILYATIIILLALAPMMAMPGEQGRLFRPLGLAYIVSISASLLVSITVTPALASYLLPRRVGQAGAGQAGAGQAGHGGAMVSRWLRSRLGFALAPALARPWPILSAAALAVLLALLALPWLPRSFLPPFNEGTLYAQMLAEPGTSLAEASRIGHLAERIIQQVPEVVAVARRTGRSEFDEDGDPVNSNEFPIRVHLAGRSRAEVIEDIRRRLSILPADLVVTQFLTSRMQVADNGVKGALVAKIFGPDLATLRLLARQARGALAGVPGLRDLLVEQQALAPQVRIAFDYDRAKLFGVTPAALAATLEHFSNGSAVSQVIETDRRFDVVLKLADTDRTPEALSALRVETPTGRVPLSSLARITVANGPNMVMREGGERRIVVTANTDESDMAEIVRQARAGLAALALPPGYRIDLQGDFRREEDSRLTILAMAAAAVLLVFAVLRQRFQSTVLSLIIMGNIPLALVGSIAALWLWGEDLSLAAMIGFIAVTGVAVRNGLLKVSHFLNLQLGEGMAPGDALILRGSAERLVPVLMTALATGCALIPLLFASDVPGMELLHPVAVTIFGGLVSATLLDTFTTPALFARFGQAAAARMLRRNAALASETF